MWLVKVSVMLAVVQWGSRAGGSPRLPMRRMPPLRGVSAARADAAVTRATTTKATRALRKTNGPAIRAPPAVGSRDRCVDFARPRGGLSTGTWPCPPSAGLEIGAGTAEVMKAIVARELMRSEEH